MRFSQQMPGSQGLIHAEIPVGFVLYRNGVKEKPL